MNKWSEAVITEIKKEISSMTLRDKRANQTTLLLKEIKKLEKQSKESLR